MTIGVLLVDDHVIVRDGLKTLLEVQADLRVVGQAANGREAVSAVRQLKPDIVVMDISMPDMNGVEVARRVLAAAGSELVAAVRAVHAGRRYLAEKINELVIAGYLGERRAGSPLESLSKRERDILQHIVDGCSNRETAELLHISVKTVETYRSRMLQKLGIKNVTGLVKFAISHGLTQVK